MGYKTDVVACLLSVSLVLEALYAWNFWSVPGEGYSFSHHRRALHYREHFVTKLGISSPSYARACCGTHVPYGR